MKLFVNTVTKECGMYNPSDLDNRNWIEAPKGTQAVYLNTKINTFVFYQIENGDFKFYSNANKHWLPSPFTLSELGGGWFKHLTHLWGTLPDFEF